MDCKKVQIFSNDLLHCSVQTLKKIMFFQCCFQILFSLSNKGFSTDAAKFIR